MVDTIYTSDTGVSESESKGTGFFLGGVVLVLFAMFFIFYGLPAIREGSLAPTQPAATSESSDGVSLAVPDQIDVNVNQAEK